MLAFPSQFIYDQIKAKVQDKLKKKACQDKPIPTCECFIGQEIVEGPLKLRVHYIMDTIYIN